LKVYRYDLNEVTTCVLSCDPGVRTGAFCFLDREGKKLITGEHITTEKVMFMSFPALFPRVKEAAVSFTELVKPYLSDTTELILEYTFLMGQFSVGLSLFNALFVDGLLRNRQAGRILFVPPRLGSFFLKKKKTTKREHINLAKSLFPELPKKISQHECDAILMLMAARCPLVQRTFDIEYRVPLIEEVNVDISGAFGIMSVS
jgi:hypothetical protein